MLRRAALAWKRGMLARGYKCYSMLVGVGVIGAGCLGMLAGAVPLTSQGMMYVRGSSMVLLVSI